MCGVSLCVYVCLCECIVYDQYGHVYYVCVRVCVHVCVHVRMCMRAYVCERHKGGNNCAILLLFYFIRSMGVKWNPPNSGYLVSMYL